MSFPRIVLLLVLAGGLTANAFAQPGQPVIDNDFVQKQFGSNCSLLGMPSMQADLDGDGVPDVVIAARCTSPMMDSAEQNYMVIDPYNAFFGYGNPKITTQFSTEDPDRRGFALLIIHGRGPEAWHSDTPKAKFMIVNLPFKSVYVKKMAYKKKERLAIYIDETGGDAMSSALFWDGKRYRYEPLGSNLE
jgi:hypothetical protein